MVIGEHHKLITMGLLSNPLTNTKIMHIQLTTNEIARHLQHDEYSSFSRKGAYALAEWLENWEEDTGKEKELDVVAIRCDYTEYDSLFDWASQFYGDEDPIIEEEFSDEWARDRIEENGILIEFDGGRIVSEF